MAGDTLPKVSGVSSSGMGDILGLLNTVLGQKQITSSAGNVQPLQDLISQIQAQSGAQGEALINSLFSKATGAIPGIMGNTFNATGSRQAGDSMPAQLQKLLQDTVLQGQSQLVQQQTANNQLIGQAAAQIAANTRRGTTQTQVGGRDTIAKLGQVVGASKLTKTLTGYDPIKELTSGIQSMFTGGSPGIPTTGFLGNDLMASAGSAFGGVGDSAVINSANALTSGDLMSSLGDTGQAIMNYFASPSATTTDAGAGADLSSLFSSGSATTAPTISSPELSLGSGDVSTNYGNTDLTNFSTGGSSNTGGITSAQTGQYLAGLNYIDKPSSIKNIFDFSDGNFADDIGDITDAVSIVYPPAALVRPTLNSAAAAGESIDDFVHDPGQWFDRFIKGDDPTFKNVENLVTGTVQNLENLGQGVINTVNDAANAVGDFFGDIFGW